MSGGDGLYGSDFYEGQGVRSLSSARVVVPLIAAALKPVSTLDVGCGIGHWVREFARAGAVECHGLDGPWARASSLIATDGKFFEIDFATAPMPFRPPLPRERYDVVTSFEFAEHVDPGRAEALVELFCSLSDAVVLGAAIPHQTGVNHVNEQWPGYWAELFARRGYVACDFLRPAIWRDDRVEPWYAQNTLGYFLGGVPASVKAMAEAHWAEFAAGAHSLVHPAQWEHVHPPETVRRAAFRLARAIKRRIAG